MVTMQNNKTRGTRELSPTQRHINLSPASATSMTASSGLGILQELSTKCYLFVGHHIHKHFPRSVRYMFSKMMISDHIFDVKIFTSNYTVSQSEASAQFMQEVSTNVADFKMLSGKFESCLSSVCRAFDFPAHSSLQFFEPMLCFNQEVGIFYDFAIGQSGKAFQPNINTYFAFRGMLHSNIRQFTAESGKPLPSFVLFDSESFNLSFRNSVEDDWQIANLRYLNVLVADELEAELRVSDAINPALVARKTFFFRMFFYPAKEVSKSFVNSVRNILLGLRMNIRIFTRKIFVKVKLIKINIAKLVSIFIQRKKLIVDLLASDERINQSDFLFPARINPKFIRQQAHVNWLEDGILYKAYARMSSGIVPIHPTAKAMGILGTEL